MIPSSKQALEVLQSTLIGADKILFPIVNNPDERMGIQKLLRSAMKRLSQARKSIGVAVDWLNAEEHESDPGETETMP